MARKSWDRLSDNYRARLERKGVTRSAYESGTSMQGARGHHVSLEGIPESQQSFYGTEWKRRKTLEVNRNPDANRGLIARRYQSAAGAIRVAGRDGVELRNDLSPAERRIAAEHMNAIGAYLRNDADASVLERFQGVTVGGVELAAYEDAVLSLYNTGQLSFDLIYER